MNISTQMLGLVLCGLIAVAVFFSAAETSMMALNRYRVRHMARHGNRRATRVMLLLSRPDRLLGVILIGNTFATILASSVATMIASRYWGEGGILLATLLLTFIMLLFGEITPKTLAALHPIPLAFSAAWILQILLAIFKPLVFVLNGLANGVLSLFRIKVHGHRTEALSAEELRTVVIEAGDKISTNYQQMLLRILESERVHVEDVMVPRRDVEGIDLTEPWEKICMQLMTCSHAHLPVYRESLDNVVGMLTLRRVLSALTNSAFDLTALCALLEEVYFVPEITLLHQQLLNFQQEKRSVGLVVDEYGDIQGLVSLQDILEEIVGEFASVGPARRGVKSQPDGSVIADGTLSIRDFNRETG
ncbi:MAG: magnesium/cobalt efflux protein, partial [Gammaproteobacteria bacterium RIFCSPHIGHO2_12_FULL_45_9]